MLITASGKGAARLEVRQHLRGLKESADENDLIQPSRSPKSINSQAKYLHAVSKNKTTKDEKVLTRVRYSHQKMHCKVAKYLDAHFLQELKFLLAVAPCKPTQE
jgi:hypothetical protein